MTDEGVQPLCPGLYAALRDRFGTVKIANEGEPMSIERRIVAVGNNRSWEVVDSGEYYRVDCPFCNDTNQKLWINHRWCQTDPGGKWPMRWLAICYKNNCLRGPARRQQLEDMVFGHQNVNVRNRFQVRGDFEFDTSSKVAEEVPVPGRIIPLTHLPKDHPAVEYLEDRNYDIAYLSHVWGVGYCASVTIDKWDMLQHRIYMPAFFKGKLVGWQGRFIGELNWKESHTPKYYGLPGMKKRLFLANLERAATTRAVVLTEGLLDTTSVGLSGVPLLGKTLSERQLLLLCQGEASEKPVVVMLDPGAEDDGEQAVTVEKLRQARGAAKVVDVSLSALHRDPGETDNGVLWEWIERHAEEQGVAL